MIESDANSNDLQRATAFIARHQWLLVRGEYGRCLEPEQPTDWTYERFSTFVDASRWDFAKKMPKNPHYYTLRVNAADHRTFDQAVLFIRQFGKIEHFKSQPYKMLAFGGYKYWTMGCHLCDTILINRKSVSVTGVTAGQPEVEPTYFLGFWPARQEYVAKSECRVRDPKTGRAQTVDEDDFEFFARLIQRYGRNNRGRRYLDVHNFVYWVTGRTAEDPKIYRAPRP